MLLSITFLALVDSVVNVNLIGFIPEKISNVIHIKEITINGLFNILFIVFEFLSILKNMTLIKLPIPRKVQQWLEDIMDKFTGELERKKGGITYEKRNGCITLSKKD